MMAKGDLEGQIFLSRPHTNNVIFFSRFLNFTGQVIALDSAAVKTQNSFVQLA